MNSKKSRLGTRGNSPISAGSKGTFNLTLKADSSALIRQAKIVATHGFHTQTIEPMALKHSIVLVDSR